jgi:hypothetical protein
MALSISSAWWSLSWLSFHSSACADSLMSAGIENVVTKLARWHSLATVDSVNGRQGHTSLS